MNMRSLSRNKQRIFYSLYTGKQEVRDEYGNLVSEPILTYDEPVEYYINVSAARGTADVEQFGINTNYSKTMVTNDLDCPINETTRVWIDREPTEPHNYVVVMVARSINSITYAIKEVSVT
jgi:hypothetical protein